MAVIFRLRSRFLLAGSGDFCSDHAVGKSGSIEKLCRASDSDLRLGHKVDGIDQRHDSRGDRFGISDRPDTFAGFRLQPDAIDRNVDNFGDSLPHSVGMRSQPRLLGQDHAIEIADFHAVMTHSPYRFDQKIGAVAFMIFVGGVGKQSSDVGFGDRTQQRIGDRVQQNVSIAVADGVYIRRDVDAADPQRSSVAQSMRVES